MDHLDGHHQVVGAGNSGIAGVSRLEVHPVGKPLALSGFLSHSDRCLVQVESVDARLRISVRDRERRNSSPAPDLGDPDRRAGGELGLYVRERREPVLHEVVPEDRPGEGGLQVLQVERAEGHARAAPELLRHDLHRLADPRRNRGARLHACLAVVVEQHVGVCVRQRETARGGRLGGVADLEDASNGLLLEPFPDVPLDGPRRVGELTGRLGAVLPQRFVQPEALPELHVGQLHGGESGHEQRASELLNPGFVRSGDFDRRHRDLLAMMADSARRTY